MVRSAHRTRLIIAVLSISASPAGIVRVANELRSVGQVFMMLLQELLGPLVTQRALKVAAETYLIQE